MGTAVETEIKEQRDESAQLFVQVGVTFCNFFAELCRAETYCAQLCSALLNLARAATIEISTKKKEAGYRDFGPQVKPDGARELFHHMTANVECARVRARFLRKQFELKTCVVGCVAARVVSLSLSHSLCPNTIEDELMPSILVKSVSAVNCLNLLFPDSRVN